MTNTIGSLARRDGALKRVCHGGEHTKKASDEGAEHRVTPGLENLLVYGADLEGALREEVAMTYEVRQNWVALAGFAVLTEAVGALSAGVGGRTDSRWYQNLRKPPFQPPGWVFPVAWSALYASVAWSGARVWRLPASQRRARALRWWAVQLGLNALWSPLFFRLRRPRAALVDCALLLAAASRYALLAGHLDRAAGAAVLPYLGWLGFANVLNAEIVRRN